MSLEKVKQIHEASMRILRETGVRFLHPDAVKVLQNNETKMEGDIAYFTEDQIMEWVGKAPDVADVYAANEEFNISLGGDRTYNAPAAGPVNIFQPDGTKRAVKLADFIQALKLYEANSSYKVNGGIPCQPTDVPSESASLLLHYVSLIHSEKTLWSGTGNYHQMEAIVELTNARFDQASEDIAENPHVFSIVNTNSPLQFDINMTETLFTFLKYRIPIIITSAAMAGATTPMTLAGSLAVLNAEIIATVAMAQMFAPGAPVLYGSQSATSDMRDGSVAIGSAEGALCYKYCAEMARFYGIPSRGGGALTDSKKVDAQAGYESMLTYYTCKDSRMNIVFQSAGILDSYLDLSFEKMIVDFEIIDYVNRFKAEFEVNEDTVPFEDIQEVGHGGQYLLTDHTLMNCRSEPLIPQISTRGSLEDSQTRLETNIANRLNAMLDAYKKPSIDEDTHERMRAVLRNYGIDDDMINWLDSF